MFVLLHSIIDREEHEKYLFKLLSLSRHTVVCRVAKDAGTRHTVSILTGRSKMQFSHMHNSVTLSEKYAIFVLQLPARYLWDATQRILIILQ